MSKAPPLAWHTSRDVRSTFQVRWSISRKSVPAAWFSCSTSLPSTRQEIRSSSSVMAVLAAWAAPSSSLAVHGLLYIRAHGVGGQGSASAPCPQVEPKGQQEQQKPQGQHAQREPFCGFVGKAVEPVLQFFHAVFPLSVSGRVGPAVLSYCSTVLPV